MTISSLQLDAFWAVAKNGGFSAAARELSLTQSALSQRVSNLEDELGLTLLIRNPGGVALTPQGERLLRYCLIRASLESELIQDMNVAAHSKVAGTIRIAGYSSILRSVIIPALRPLIAREEDIFCEFICSDTDVRGVNFLQGRFRPQATS